MLDRRHDDFAVQDPRAELLPDGVDRRMRAGEDVHAVEKAYEQLIDIQLLERRRRGWTLRRGLELGDARKGGLEFLGEGELGRGGRGGFICHRANSLSRT